MKSKVIVQMQSINGQPQDPLEIAVDKFNLKEDYFDYQVGIKKDPNGNAVMGAMIGPNHYVRFSDVINIAVEPINEVEENG